MKIYVAGASKEIERVKAAMLRVKNEGWEVTVDWPSAIEAAGTANEGLSPADRSGAAREDMCGVIDADVLWLLAPEAASAGCWVELGMALMDDSKWIIISGRGRHKCVFGALANEEWDSDEQGFQALKRLAQSRGVVPKVAQDPAPQVVDDDEDDEPIVLDDEHAGVE